MKPRGWRPIAAACGLVVAAAACSQTVRPPQTAPRPAPPAPRPAPLSPLPSDAPDRIGALIAEAEAHFLKGEREFALGHLQEAKREFDLAVDLILAYPEGARSDRRLATYFDRLVDRISAVERQALAQGDGFAERPSDPAMIDELLEVATFPLPEAAPGTRESVAQDLQKTAHDIPIPLNARVLSYVELFQGRLREWFQRALERGAQYLPMIQNVLRAEGLPLDLAYVPLVESAFNPNALSRARAKGLWQFMLGTARLHGLRYDWYVDERADPEKATVAAAKYLRSLAEAFGGDWHLALASYNGGPGRVQSAIARAKVADFWTLSQSSRYLPRETREYVPMILAAIIIAKNPAQYGFQIAEAAAAAVETVTLPMPVDLRRVAEWIGVPVDDIQALNPELRRWTTPLRDTAYPLRVPAGTGERVLARLASASPAERIAVSEYVIRPGDTLTAIARRLRVGVTDLADANGLSPRALIRPGQRLVVPRAPAPVLAARPAPAAAAAVVRAAGPSVRATSTVVYRERRGDTLWSIAQEFDTTVEAIKSWNKLRTNRINVGDRLTIYPRRSGTN
jgi:membrane-bound lytic murein transglycosylase D